MNNIRLITLSALVLLVGCQTTPVTDPSSLKYLPPPGTVFELLQPITIPARRVNAFIQNGEAVGGTGEYYPGCKLIVRDVSPQPQVIEPDRFVIVKSSRFVDTVVLVQLDGLQLAELGTQIAQGGGGGDSGPTDYRYVTRLTLQSDKQPQVKRLDCQQLDDPGLGRHVSFDEIRMTLAPTGKLVRADGQPFPPPQKPPY